MSCPFGAIDTASRRWHKLRVAFVERSEFQDEQDVRLNPEMKVADWEQDAFGLLPTRAPILFETGGECLFLLAGLELRQQGRVTDADLLAIECFDRARDKLGQAEARRHISRTLARLRGDLLYAVFRLFQVEQGAEAVGLFQRMNVAALEVFNQLRLQHFGIGHVLNTYGHGGNLGQLRGAVAPGSEDNLEAAFTKWPHKQGLIYPLVTDCLGHLFQSIVLEDAAGVGGRFREHRERKVAVLRSVRNGGIHGGLLLSSG